MTSAVSAYWKLKNVPFNVNVSPPLACVGVVVTISGDNFLGVVNDTQVHIGKHVLAFVDSVHKLFIQLK